MKNLITLLLVFFLASCSKNNDLEGYWYGEYKFDNGRVPMLIKFEKGFYIDFFGVIDTIEYKRSGNNIYFKKGADIMHEFKIELKNNELSTYKLQSDSLIAKLKKSESNNFIFDYLNDKTLQINLPIGKGLEHKIGFYQLKYPLYLTYKGDHLIANFLDTTVVVDNDYHKFLFNKKTFLDEIESFSNSNRISLIADENLKISDINLLRKQLRIVGFSRIDYYLKSRSYDKVNILTSRLRPLTEKEFNEFNTKENPILPLPPPFIDYIPNFKGDLVLVKIKENVLTVNDSVVAIDELGKFLKPKILLEKELAILYYISENSKYENFIRLSEIVYSTYYDVRDDYMMENYGIKFRDKYFYSDERVNDMKKKYPLIFGQLNKEEYNKIKYNL